MEEMTSPTLLKQPTGEDPGENDSKKCQNDMTMFAQVTKPIVLSMKMLGMWHEWPSTIHPRGQAIDDSKPKKPVSSARFVLNRLTVFYHIIITVLLWFDFFRFTVAAAPELSLQNSGYICWFLQTAATNTVLFMACYRCCKIRSFYQLWQNSPADKYLADSNQRRSVCPTMEGSHLRKKFKRAGMIAALGGWSFLLLSYPLSMYFTFSYDQDEGFRRLCIPWSNNDAICGFIQVIHFFALACHKFPIAYLCLICYIVSKRFDTLTESFKKHNPLGTLVDVEVLETTRRQHNILCLLVTQCDYIFSTVVAIAFATNIPLLIFLIYDVYLNSNEIPTLWIVTSCYWGISNFANIALLSWFCSLLHEKAHSLRRHVFELHVDSSDTKTAHVHMLLVSRLNGPHIGISFIGFFTITRNVILTIAGFVLTYFTLLIDLGPDIDHTCTNTTSR